MVKITPAGYVEPQPPSPWGIASVAGNPLHFLGISLFPQVPDSGG
jgi:hypothetical protein